ncbi:hypothetical protein BDZ89DRAFT_1118657 [Hymenopellis radicata]|nr:hypothetical protein BDZ89DRAFT_1118657 [Hymenopellis radicata]
MGAPRRLARVGGIGATFHAAGNRHVIPGFLFPSSHHLESLQQRQRDFPASLSDSLATNPSLEERRRILRERAEAQNQPQRPNQQFLDPELAKREQQLREALAHEHREEARATARWEKDRMDAVAGQQETIRLLEEELKILKDKATRRVKEETAEERRRSEPPPVQPTRSQPQPEPDSDYSSGEEEAPVENISPADTGPIVFTSEKDLDKALRAMGYCKLSERRKRSGSSTKATKSPSQKKLKAAETTSPRAASSSSKHARSPAADKEPSLEPGKKRRLAAVDDASSEASTAIPAYLIKILADGWSEPIRFSEFTAEACAADRRRDLARDTNALRFNTISGEMEIKKGSVKNGVSDLVLDKLPWLDGSGKFCDGVEKYYVRKPCNMDLPDGPELANQFRTILKTLTSKSEWTSDSPHGFMVIKMYMETVLATFWRSNLAVDVSIFGQQVWADCHTQEWMNKERREKAKVAAPAAAPQSSFRQKQTSQKTSAPSSQSAGSQSTAASTAKKDKCCWCGSWEHIWKNCPGGPGLHCHKNSAGYWVDAKGAQYCLGHNSNVGCKREARGKGCDVFFTHSCSLCGSRSHGAQDCSK